MTTEELDQFLGNNLDIEWAFDDDGAFYLRHTRFDKENEKTKIEPKALKNLTPEKLMQVLVAGRNVEHITRVTGYFSRISGWNKGKKGELAERQRVQV